MSRRLRGKVLVAAFCAAFGWSSTAAALELLVDPSGGSLLLEEVVQTALDDWRAAGADPDAVDAVLRVVYGDAERFGDDVLLWLLLRSETQAEGRGSDRRPSLPGVPDAAPTAPVASFEIQVNPGVEPSRAAFIPALGVVLGGRLGEGSLNPYVDPGLPNLPSQEEAAALERQRSAVLGDLNGDGLVDFEDLLLLAAEHGRRGLNIAADLDRDGVVGDGDLDLLRSVYTFSGPAQPEGAGPGDAPAEQEPGETPAVQEPDEEPLDGGSPEDGAPEDGEPDAEQPEEEQPGEEEDPSIPPDDEDEEQEQEGRVD